MTAIFTSAPGCRPGTQHAKPAAIPDGRCTWRLSGCVPTAIHVERVTVERVTRPDSFHPAAEGVHGWGRCGEGHRPETAWPYRRRCRSHVAAV